MTTSQPGRETFEAVPITVYATGGAAITFAQLQKANFAASMGLPMVATIGGAPLLGSNVGLLAEAFASGGTPYVRLYTYSGTVIASTGGTVQPLTELAAGTILVGTVASTVWVNVYGRGY